jgi:hypothetical protein
MHSIMNRLREHLARRRLEKQMRECQQNIRWALDHLNFAQHMLRVHEKKHARIAFEMAKLESPDDIVRRAFTI